MGKDLDDIFFEIEVEEEIEEINLRDNTVIEVYPHTVKFNQ